MNQDRIGDFNGKQIHWARNGSTKDYRCARSLPVQYGKVDLENVFDTQLAQTAEWQEFRFDR